MNSAEEERRWRFWIAPTIVGGLMGGLLVAWMVGAIIKGCLGVDGRVQAVDVEASPGDYQVDVCVLPEVPEGERLGAMIYAEVASDDDLHAVRNMHLMCNERTGWCCQRVSVWGLDISSAALLRVRRSHERDAKKWEIVQVFTPNEHTVRGEATSAA